MKNTKKYTVFRDTREQQGWVWKSDDFCDGMKDVTLATGDYTIKGYEDYLIVERKASVSELARNITEDRFEREMERLTLFPYPYIVLEFGFSDVMAFPKGAGLPPKVMKQIKVTPNFILSRIAEYEIKYGVRFHFCDNRSNAMWFVSNLFRKVANSKIGS